VEPVPWRARLPRIGEDVSEKCDLKDVRERLSPQTHRRVA
jgi:hypothetical protein